MTYNIISENSESTLVGEFRGKERKDRNYQSEAQLEEDFIKSLCKLGYQYLPIVKETDLIINLRKQLEQLNNYTFTDNEWQRFFDGEIAAKNLTVKDKARTIQTNVTKLLQKDDGRTKNIILLDKENIFNNSLQVINQYENNDGKRPNRYDVTILVNGLPLVHLELKRRGVDIKEAFNQIKRYQRESFWAGSGLYDYIQIFVISNGTLTKYYSNTTREGHIKSLNDARSKSRKVSASFEFTSYWTDLRNNKITDLLDFAETFFAKHTLLNILTKYCVFTVDEDLMVMRPYQIAATEKIIQKIRTATQYKQYGTTQAGGYIWHTTGSGKTLTSFKTSQLASRLSEIDKTLFVVDRKDLDYQTIKEYEKFQKGAVSDSKSAADLQEKLEDTDKRIIVTTIQKLYKFITKNPKHEIYSKNVVIIFDECHRSQFSDMHAAIVKHFKKYYLFGFTGTPIFADNSSSSFKANMKTTEQVFGERLHIYTIVNAINDNNVLPFRVDYVQTMKKKEGVKDEQVWGINKESAFQSEENIKNVVGYILEHFDQKTKRNEGYTHKFEREENFGTFTFYEKRLGFNSIFCVSSIPALIKYYKEFQRQMKDLPESKRLKIATIFSFSPNEDTDTTEQNGMLGEENSDSTDGLDASSRDFLDSAIEDYNKMFATSFSTQRFSNYYKDVSQRVKSREVDLLLVVNMFLTGFDAKCLNTLWVDKNLKLHGLLQAFSRTNRIYNSVKTFGNIVCFRNLEEETNRSIGLFSDENAGGIILLRKFADYMNGYTDDDGYHKGYVQLAEELQKEFPLNNINAILEQGETTQKEFIRLYNSMIKARNILECFDEFEDVIAPLDFQDYTSIYLDVYHKLRQEHKKEDINDDIVFEIELVKQVEVNIDYILSLIKKYHKSNLQDKEIRLAISKAIGGSMSLRNKKELIENFIDSLTVADKNIDDKWNTYVETQKEEELKRIIDQERLKEDKTRELVQTFLREGYVKEEGTDIANILPPMSRFSQNKGEERTQKKNKVIEKLKEYIERFKDLI